MGFAPKKKRKKSKAKQLKLRIPMPPPQKPHSTPKGKRGYRRSENKRKARQPEPGLVDRGFSIPPQRSDGD